MATRHDEIAKEIAKNVTNFNADDNASASTEIIEIENAEIVPALTLPPEILRHICEYLSRKDTLNLRLSHSRFRDHVNTIPSTFSPLVVSNGLKTIFLYNGSVFTCGQNRFGELGHGDTIDKLSPTHIDRAVFQGKQVARVVAAAAHTIFLCDDGSVFTCGYNDFGQLGHGDTTDKLSPTHIGSAVFQGKRVVQVLADSFHTIFLCKDGSVFTCGRNDFGQLGHGDTTDKLSPTHIGSAVFQGKQVVQVVAGSNHTIFRCDDGSVFTCGRNCYGQLGHGDTPDKLSLTHIDRAVFQGKKVVQVVAGSYHTIFLCDDGSVFTCGRNCYGQLGHGDTPDKLSPTHIDRAVFQGKKVVQVAVGMYHTIILCDDGSVFACGRNDKGQLGHGDTTEKLSPTLINSDVFQGKKVVEVVAGPFHTIFRCDDGSVFSCGNNKFGQLGHGDMTDKLSPTLIDSAVFDYKRVVQVVARGFNSFFFCENGRVFSCGENENGQLGLNDTTNRLLPTEVLAMYNPYFEAMRLRKVLLGKIVSLNLINNDFKEKVGEAVAMVLGNTRFSPAIPGALLKALNMLNGEPCYDKNSKTKYESQLKADIEELTLSKDAQAPFAPLFQKTLREIEWLEELAERDTDGQSLKTSTSP